jgi:hypothetical protein
MPTSVAVVGTSVLCIAVLGLVVFLFVVWVRAMKQEKN